MRKILNPGSEETTALTAKHGGKLKNENPSTVGKRLGTLRHSSRFLFSLSRIFSISPWFLNIFFTFLILIAAASCGYLHNPRVSRAYVDNLIPDSAAANLVLWPVHVTALLACGIVDQTMRTFEILPPTGRDGVDFFLIRGNGNNIMLERTVAIPKIIATPIVMLGSYLVRWLFPLGEDARPFRDFVSSEKTLHQSAESGDVSAARSAIAGGADINERDNREWTALMIAANAGHKDFVAMLLTEGADISLRNKDGKTAEDLAALAGRKEIQELIRKTTQSRIDPEKK